MPRVFWVAPGTHCMLVLRPALGLRLLIFEMSPSMERAFSNQVSGLDFLGRIPFQTFHPPMYLLGPQVQILWKSVSGGVCPFEQVRVGQRVSAEELRVSQPLFCSSAVWWMRWTSPPWIWMMHSGSSNPTSGFRVRPKKWNDSSKPSGAPASHC